MKFNWIDKCVKHDFKGYPLYSLGLGFKIGRLEIILSEPKDTKIVDRCKKCGKIKLI